MSVQSGLGVRCQMGGVPRRVKATIYNLIRDYFHEYEYKTQTDRSTHTPLVLELKPKASQESAWKGSGELLIMLQHVDTRSHS